MKPALSVILFSVLSGAGLGALALMALADLACRAGAIEAVWTPALTAAAAIAGLKRRVALAAIKGQL